MEIDYTDQACNKIQQNGFQMFSALTPYGVKQIESEFITRIMCINDKVKTVYQIDRVKETFISKLDGKVHEGMNYETIYREIDINGKQCGYGLKIVWENGKYREFNYNDDFPIFDEETRKEIPNILKKSIKSNPHLHKVIKDNLLFNLKNSLKQK